MCLIVRAKAGIPIPKELIVDAYRGNSDGYGLMWFDPDKGVQTVKAHAAKPKVIYRQCARVEQFDRVLHMRFATHGAVDHANTHPFEVVDGVWMMHNGVLSDMPHRKGKSDSAVFVEEYLRPLLDKDPQALDNPGVVKLIDALRGTSNRIVFMDSKGVVTILGEDLGLMWKGLWCSNTYAWSLWGGNRQSMYSPGTILPASTTLTYGTGADKEYADYDYDWPPASWTSDGRTPIPAGQSTGLTVASPVKSKSTVVRVVKGEKQWITDFDNIISQDVAELLTNYSVEIEHICRDDPDRIIAFIDMVRDKYIGSPIETVDEDTSAER